jgi:hypothetical protein
MDMISGGAASQSANTSDLRSKSKGKDRKSRRKPLLEQRFSSYLSFGFQGTLCIGVFLACYALVLVAIWPLMGLRPSNYSNSSGDGGATDGSIGVPHAHPENFHQVVESMHVPKAVKEAHLPPRLNEMASEMKKQFNQLRKGRGVTDSALLDQTKVDFERLRIKKERDRAAAAGTPGRVVPSSGKILETPVSPKQGKMAAAQQQVGEDPTGFIVLGMHRSGTSMLSGLLVTSCEYKVGGPLIGASFDNEKGFYERIDIVLQNDEFMNKQGVWWSSNVNHYDYQKALKDKETKAITFDHGKPGLAFLDNPSSAPWLQKDPRMCITLKTWLELMNNAPAVVFTYRHPLEVAMSLKKRERNFSLEHGLRLWIVYNMRAIQNSKGLCVVKSSNDAIMKDPLAEVQRISDELTRTCKVPAPPNRVLQEDVDKFVDPSLQHNNNKRRAEEQTKKVIAEYNDGKCLVMDYETDTEEGTTNRERELKLYGQAMKIYCDFQSEKAYEDDYEWPILD